MNNQQILDELTYRSYAFNRSFNPSIAVNRWMQIFQHVPEMEVRYQKENPR